MPAFSNLTCCQYEQLGDEIASGGKDGVGQGVASFFSNVVGGVFEWGKHLSFSFSFISVSSLSYCFCN